MRISDVARETGVPVSTIRFYERRAIIPKPLRSGRDRVFRQADVAAIAFVRDAQTLGLPLAEISVLLQGSWRDGNMVQLARKHRVDVQAKMEALSRIDRMLAELEKCNCDSFSDCDLSASPCCG